jgi:hypothetical protein
MGTQFLSIAPSGLQVRGYLTRHMLEGSGLIGVLSFYFQRYLSPSQARDRLDYVPITSNN